MRLFAFRIGTHFSRLSRSWTVARGVLTLALALVLAAGLAQRGKGGAPGLGWRAPADQDERIAEMISAPPARFAALDIEVQKLLARSLLARTLIRPDGTGFSGHTIWEFIDSSMTGSQLQTLVEIHHVARHLGIWDSIETLRQVYAWSSWGIDFNGRVDPLRVRTGRDDFCHDIDAIVRREHGNTRHEWWRSLWNWDGVGSPHLGIDAGEGFLNLHLDSTGPAESRGWLGDDARCRYGIARVITHNVEIRLYSEGDTTAIRGFLQIERMAYAHRHALSWLRNDLTYAPPSTTTSWVPVRDRLAAIESDGEALVDEAKGIASLEDGYLRIESLISGAARPYSRSLLEGLHAFAETALSEGLSNGYLVPLLIDLPIELPMLGSPEARADLATLESFRDKVADSSKPIRVTQGEIDQAMGAYYHVRQHTVQGGSAR